ncbi:hypothetical protein C8R45DRAFT_947639 [Mycena sanguinolenta]|nr:hypothetical protein C8R45DRAFT_947639 [Mycena sanguinolenta]
MLPKKTNLELRRKLREELNTNFTLIECIRQGKIQKPLTPAASIHVFTHFKILRVPRVYPTVALRDDHSPFRGNSWAAYNPDFGDQVLASWQTLPSLLGDDADGFNPYCRWIPLASFGCIEFAIVARIVSSSGISPGDERIEDSRKAPSSRKVSGFALRGIWIMFNSRSIHFAFEAGTGTWFSKSRFQTPTRNWGEGILTESKIQNGAGKIYQRSHKKQTRTSSHPKCREPRRYRWIYRSVEVLEKQTKANASNEFACVPSGQ